MLLASVLDVLLSLDQVRQRREQDRGGGWWEGVRAQPAMRASRVVYRREERERVVMMRRCVVRSIYDVTDVLDIRIQGPDVDEPEKPDILAMMTPILGSVFGQNGSLCYR